MPTYSVDPKIFEIFPAFRRGVVIATQLDNTAPDPALANLIQAASDQLLATSTDTEPEHISVWNNAYLKLGVDPKKFTPSIKFLYEQIRKGKPPRSISKIVDIMNLVSLRRMAPCGGDDLQTILPGGIHLGFAKGDESFAPLFKATAFEKPLAGEVIYYTPQTKKVMCRRWTWRNADFSKITLETTSVAINIDIMAPPFAPTDVDAALAEMAKLLEQYCGGKTVCYTLAADTPSFEL
jgi:DNA/RNA-binding domain of Phe-tRNA-synthetase-like protein